MKSGAGDDPFSDLSERDDEDGQSGASDASSEAAVGDDGSNVESAGDDPARTATGADATDTPDASADVSPADPSHGEDGIPWILRRRSVKDDRPNVTQFFLRDETDRAERRFRGEVEERLDTDVYLLDLREAAYVVAMQHPEEVASLLGRWGYDYRD
jgi:hypothetical protein